MDVLNEQVHDRNATGFMRYTAGYGSAIEGMILCDSYFSHSRCLLRKGSPSRRATSIRTSHWPGSVRTTY